MMNVRLEVFGLSNFPLYRLSSICVCVRERERAINNNVCSLDWEETDGSGV